MTARSTRRRTVLLPGRIPAVCEHISQASVVLRTMVRMSLHGFGHDEIRFINWLKARHSPDVKRHGKKHVESISIEVRGG